MKHQKQLAVNDLICCPPVVFESRVIKISISYKAFALQIFILLGLILKKMKKWLRMENVSLYRETTSVDDKFFSVFVCIYQKTVINLSNC